MGAIIVASKTDTSGSVTPSALSTETALYTPGSQTDDALIEGYVSLQNMASGDAVVVTEYMSVDGTNYEILNQQTYSGAQTDPTIRFVGKMIGPKTSGSGGGQLWKATVNQTAGTLRAFPFSFVLEVLGAT